MPDWNTRLEIRLGNTVIAPISQFTPTFNVPHTVIHSIEQDNLGYVRQPQTFTFTMTVQAIGTAVADLTELAVKGKEFEITVAEKKGTDWTFKALKFSRCVITSANPSNVVIDGAPSASFTCMSLSPGVES
ncbi:hypothetical protein [Bailinhaonella thermotolerans]|uniref:Phage tail protein n=1 Tax=Bailinhaonella thermotolerans TaxID=1070861 RepID=A0A3A4B130_9ACTN|nr:hypothetical protein [Bailinhaonella thermotolerans]RJL35435.1 hypothetical protein D5H75_01060 [Bailinhaonella thermotolerans]